MARQSKAPAGWGELNVALNGLVKKAVIVGYKTGSTDGATSVEVSIERGADQADVVRQVREALPQAFSDATVRTRVA